MATALIGLVGGIAGAVIALVGSVIGDRRRARTEAERWRREQLSEAYRGAIKHLLRLASGHPTASRSAPDKFPKEVIPKERFQEWLTDVAEAQFWLHAFAASCSAKRLGDANQAISRFDQGMTKSKGGLISAVFFGPPADIEISWIRGAVDDVIKILTRCARADLAIDDSALPA
jgi:hypothetical protein